MQQTICDRRDNKVTRPIGIMLDTEEIVITVTVQACNATHTSTSFFGLSDRCQ